MSNRIIVAVIALCTICVLGDGRREASAATIWESNLPDMYQHQKSGPKAWFEAGYAAPNPPPAPLAPGYTTPDWWEPTGGWCGTTAWSNSIYHWSTRGGGRRAGLVDHHQLPNTHAKYDAVAVRPWQDRFAYVNEDLAISGGGFGCATTGRVRSYVDEYIPDAGLKLTLDEYEFAPTGGPGGTPIVKKYPNGGAPVDTTYTSMFEAYADLLPGNASVVIEITYDTPPATGPWWRNSFHFITGGGVDAATKGVYFADPNNTFWDLGTDPARPYGWGYSYQPNVGDPRYTADIPISTSYYQLGTTANGRMFDSGPYVGASIVGLYTLVPEPATLALLVAGACLAARRR